MEWLDPTVHSLMNTWSLKELGSNKSYIFINSYLTNGAHLLKHMCAIGRLPKPHASDRNQICVPNNLQNSSLHIYLCCQIGSGIYVRGRSVVAQCEQAWEWRLRCVDIGCLMIATFMSQGAMYHRSPLTH